MMKRSPRAPRHRNRLPSDYSPVTPALSSVATISALKARITTLSPVVVSGLPTGITCQGVAPTAYSVVSPTVFDLTYAANVVATNVLLIPGNVPQVRSMAGGFLASSQTTF